MRIGSKRSHLNGLDQAVLKGKPDNLPGPGKYNHLRQGVYATNSLEIHRYPKVREGVCGSALVRSREQLIGAIGWRKEKLLDLCIGQTCN